MNIFHSLFLGLIQGLTEFFPVSSSGHLVFFQNLLGMKESQIFFDVMLHLGTLLAIIVFLRKEIRKILCSIGSALRNKEEKPEGIKLFLWIILASLPTGLMGFFLKDWFESFFSRPHQVGFMLLITGGILWTTRFVKNRRKTLDRMTGYDALWIGIAQGMAIIPGISRSGTTISTGLFLGLERELAGKFSFLISIPAILGAALIEGSKLKYMGPLWIPLAGSAVAFFAGILSLMLLTKMIKSGKIFYFSYYCFAMGIVILILL